LYWVEQQPELIPDPDGLARCLSKTMRPDSWIWDQKCANGALIPDPIFSKLASVRQSEIGSGIRNYDKQPNIRHAIGGPLYRWSFASAAVVLDQEARWLYEIQPEVEGLNFNKLQASSLTMELG